MMRIVRGVLIAIPIAAVLFTWLQPRPAYAQNSNNSLSSQSRLTLQGLGQNKALMTHRNALGKPCLEFEAVSRAHVINPNVYDHVVSVYNSCVKTIKVQICYTHTTQCIDVEATSLKRKDVILGVFPSIQYFRYSYREKF